MTVFIILGAPRSGTSLVAGILHQSGISLGAKFVSGSHDQNPHGFFEDENIADHHAAILSGMGGSNHLYPPPDGRLATVNAHELAKPVLARRVTETGDWGWKDPRTVLFWSAYRRILLDWTDWGVKLIITHRNLLSIARSWLASERLDSLKYALWLAADYERRLADAALDEFPALHISFEHWWRDFDYQAGQLERVTGRMLDFGLFDEGLWRN